MVKKRKGEKKKERKMGQESRKYRILQSIEHLESLTLSIITIVPGKIKESGYLKRKQCEM